MLLSEEKKFLFIHIQKTAGSSLRSVMSEGIPDLRTMLGTHDTARDALAYMGEIEFSSYFTAAFVRNPWDRLVSWYTMIAQAKPRGHLLRRLLGSAEPRLWTYVRDNSTNFEEFLRRCTAEIEDRDGRKSFCRNQIEYLTDEHGRRIVDFVGRYENLEADAGRLFDRLGLTDMVLPRINPSRHRHYSEYYSSDLAALVRERYRSDIEAFGYEFSRPGSHA
jgi:hypothetical protein